jgi:hypothetical protein
MPFNPEVFNKLRAQAAPAGWRPEAWGRGANVSRATVYNLLSGKVSARRPFPTSNSAKPGSSRWRPPIISRSALSRRTPRNPTIPQRRNPALWRRRAVFDFQQGGAEQCPKRLSHLILRRQRQFAFRSRRSPVKYGRASKNQMTIKQLPVSDSLKLNAASMGVRREISNGAIGFRQTFTLPIVTRVG